MRRNYSENDIDKVYYIQYYEFMKKYKPPSYNNFTKNNPNATKLERVNAIINFYKYLERIT